MKFLGIDLAWKEADETKEANLSGVVELSRSGQILEAGWCRGIDEVFRWIQEHETRDVACFIDAPLVVPNDSGQRSCENQVGKSYGRWWVSANSTNRQSPHLGGVRLLSELLRDGWSYDDGTNGPNGGGKTISECYPYATIVGASELGYEERRPAYKRMKSPVSEGRKIRSRECDELISRILRLEVANPPLDLCSHAQTRRLVQEPSPIADIPYKKREDLLDAVICAWTASFWFEHGLARCHALGGELDSDGLRETIIAPVRPEQRIK